jgi:putative restriction endonuclease
MANFSALDPTISQKGMGNYSKSDGEIWAEFFAMPSTFIDKLSGIVSDYSASPSGTKNFSFEVREGRNLERTGKVRENQSYFRKMLLVSYDGKCGLTGIAQSDLLNASHIKPWATDKEARLDPRNGILLNALHDRAFDRGYITFEDDLSLVVSTHLKLPEMSRSFFQDRVLNKPERFAPDPTFLAYHREHEFEKFLS